MIAQNNDQKNCLLEILTCLICQNKANQAHICPNCSKFYCFTCIKNWIDSNQSQCPYCCKSLQEKQLVNCQKLCIDLSNALQKINQTKNSNADQNNCLTHNLKRNYYCKTCEQSLCSDCCVLVQEHKGHQFVKLSQIKKQFEKKNAKLKSKLSHLKQKVMTLKEGKIKNQSTPQKKIALKTQENFKTLQSKLKQCKDKIQKKFVASTNNIQQNLYQERNNIIDGQKTYEKLMKQLKQCQKVKLIGSQNKLISQSIVQEKQKLFVSNNKSQKIIQELSQKNIESQLIPDYQSKKFILDNYTQLKLDRKVIYSEYFRVNGLQWRLKIYPSGNDQDQGQQKSPQRLKTDNKPKFQFISIFIQLKQGLQQLGRYRHKIQLVNQVNSLKKISRQFESQFQMGSCWGYNQFAKISLLYQEDYIHPETDQMQIILYIASSTYYHANLDLCKLIAVKKKQVLANYAKIKQLIDFKGEHAVLITNNMNQEKIIYQSYKQIAKTSQQIQQVRFPRLVNVGLLK